MRDVNEYIASGILEMYVLGLTDSNESKEVEEMIVAHTEVSKEIEEIRKSLEIYSAAHSVQPHPAVKTLLMATIDYSERLKNGEKQSLPPALNENSKIIDFNQWLERDDMFVPEGADEIYAKIIGHTSEMTTAVVWIEDSVPYEVHGDRFENFLIIEGSCEIITESETYKLSAGSYFSVPLHCRHKVKVTSEITCKAILQHVAA